MEKAASQPKTSTRLTEVTKSSTSSAPYGLKQTTAKVVGKEVTPRREHETVKLNRTSIVPDLSTITFDKEDFSLSPKRKSILNSTIPQWVLGVNQPEISSNLSTHLNISSPVLANNPPIEDPAHSVKPSSSSTSLAPAKVYQHPSQPQPNRTASPIPPPQHPQPSKAGRRTSGAAPVSSTFQTKKTSPPLNDKRNSEPSG